MGNVSRVATASHVGPQRPRRSPPRCVAVSCDLRGRDTPASDRVGHRALSGGALHVHLDTRSPPNAVNTAAAPDHVRKDHTSAAGRHATHPRSHRGSSRTEPPGEVGQPEPTQCHARPCRTVRCAARTAYAPQRSSTERLTATSAIGRRVSSVGSVRRRRRSSSRSALRMWRRAPDVRRRLVTAISKRSHRDCHSAGRASRSEIPGLPR